MFHALYEKMPEFFFQKVQFHSTKKILIFRYPAITIRFFRIPPKIKSKGEVLLNHIIN